VQMLATGRSRWRSAVPRTVAVGALLGIVAGLAAAGCASDRAGRGGDRHKQQHVDKFVETVTSRAPFDLSCPAAEVQVVKLGEAAIGATGCGRQTSYSCLCTYHVFFTCTAALCSLDGANIAQPPVLQGQPPSSQPEPLPPT
jgi:hypothetical protein